MASNSNQEDPKQAVEMEDQGSGAPQHGQLIPCLCADDVVVQVPFNHLRHSHLFDNLCTNLGIGDGDEEEGGEETRRFEGEFPVQHVSSATMSKLADWCAEHAGQPDPVIEYNELFERKHFDFSEYERTFLDVTVNELKELLLAALFLDIRTLFIYAAQRGAVLMTGKNCAQIREEWGLPDDLTEEDKQKIRRENVWVRDEE